MRETLTGHACQLDSVLNDEVNLTVCQAFAFPKIASWARGDTGYVPAAFVPAHRRRDKSHSERRNARVPPLNCRQWVSTDSSDDARRVG